MEERACSTPWSLDEERKCKYCICLEPPSIALTRGFGPFQHPLDLASKRHKDFMLSMETASCLSLQEVLRVSLLVGYNVLQKQSELILMIHVLPCLFGHLAS